MNAAGDDRTKDAFRLYNEGKHQESLDCCNRLMESAREPSLEVLAATNLFCLKKYEDAEVYFRDLARKMPGSSHVHSYLAKVLEERGDEGAYAEYAEAVRLDPDNTDALRSYAGILLARNDDRGALPVLRRLCALGNRADDRDRLAGALVRSGYAGEACLLYETPGTPAVRSAEYARALRAAHRPKEAAEAALALYEERRDPELLREHLAALAETDPNGAPAAYASFCKDSPVPGLWEDYVLVLMERGDFFAALAGAKRLAALDKRPEHRLILCEVYAALGDRANADAAYEALVQEGIRTTVRAGTLRLIIRTYAGYLFREGVSARAKERFLATVSGEANVVCLTETARVHHAAGNDAEARAWYYRAYRSDFLNGGLPYALFLAACGDDRESEKVLLHILANIRRFSDLSRVAGAIASDGNLLSRMKRLARELARRLEERRALLGTAERECLAAAYLAQAEDALEDEDFATCMESCLRGIDALPARATLCHPEEFLSLVQRCKEQMPADCPAFKGNVPEQSREAPRQTVAGLADRLALTEKETAILAFLATHRRASEADLRRLTGSRRVAALVNCLIRKGAAQGIMLVEKKGMNAEGESYEYCGA
jgi:Flp pilus assembly protein TadD, contains TPR repeats